MLPIIRTNHIFDNLFDLAFPSLNNNHSFALDIYETETGYQVEADLPGLRIEDVSVTLEKNLLTIRGERQSEKTNDSNGYKRTERWSGSLTRSIRLPADIDESQVEAKLRDGVLQLKIGKAQTPKKKSRQIEIK